MAKSVLRYFWIALRLGVLLTWIAVCVSWGRSYFVSDMLWYGTVNDRVGMKTAPGQLQLFRHYRAMASFRERELWYNPTKSFPEFCWKPKGAPGEWSVSLLGGSVATGNHRSYESSWIVVIPYWHLCAVGVAAGVWSVWRWLRRRRRAGLHGFEAVPRA